MAGGRGHYRMFSNTRDLSPLDDHTTTSLHLSTCLQTLPKSSPRRPVHFMSSEHSQRTVHWQTLWKILWWRNKSFQLHFPVDLAVCISHQPWCWRRLLRAPQAARRWKESTLKAINSDYAPEALMPKPKLHHSGHLMWRANSLEKTLMLGKIERKRRRGWQRMRWLDGISDSMDMN